MQEGLAMPQKLMDFFEAGLQLPHEREDNQMYAEDLNNGHHHGLNQIEEMEENKSVAESQSQRSFRIGHIKLGSDRSSTLSQNDANDAQSDDVSVLTLESKSSLGKGRSKLPKVILKKRRKIVKKKEKAKPRPPDKNTLDIIQEWGFRKTSAKMALEYKIRKERKRKQKSKKMTAEQRYKKFLRNAQGG